MALNTKDIHFEESNKHTNSPIRMYPNGRYFNAKDGECFLKWHWHS